MKKWQDGNLLAESLDARSASIKKKKKKKKKKKLNFFEIKLDKLIHMCYNTNCNIGNTLLMFGEQYE